jgi:hypothetical protein
MNAVVRRVRGIPGHRALVKLEVLIVLALGVVYGRVWVGSTKHIWEASASAMC